MFIVCIILSELTKVDKGAAMTVVFQEAGINHISRCPQEEILIAVNSQRRILSYKKMWKNRDRKVDFPLVHMNFYQLFIFIKYILI